MKTKPGDGWQHCCHLKLLDVQSFWTLLKEAGLTESYNNKGHSQKDLCPTFASSDLPSWAEDAL